MSGQLSHGDDEHFGRLVYIAPSADRQTIVDYITIGYSRHMIDIVSAASAQSDWDAHSGSVTDGRDRRAARPADTQWPVNILVEAHRSGAARDSPLHLRSLISSPNIVFPSSKGDACVVASRPQ